MPSAPRRNHRKDANHHDAAQWLRDDWWLVDDTSSIAPALGGKLAGWPDHTCGHKLAPGLVVFV